MDNQRAPATILENETLPRRPELSAAKRALLEKRLRGDARVASRQPTIPRRAPAQRIPLSFAQQRLWFFSQLEPESPLYNMPTIFRVQGALRRGALEKSLNAILARHESLRTRFTSGGEGPVQVIDPFTPFSLPLIDLAEQPEKDREKEVEEILRRECRRPFDLTRDAMLRALLIRVSAAEHILLLNVHHIVSDGWSWSVFFRELSALYEAITSGRAADLPELPIQYADFALWQRQWLQSEVLEKQLGYWKNRLTGAPYFLDLPTDFPRPSEQSFRGCWQSASLSPQLSESLRLLSRREGATLFMTLLAAFQALLRRYTQQDDLLVGAPIAGRNQIETEPLIGFFINTLVLRTSLAGNPTFRELLRRTRDVTLEAYGNQDLPFEKLVEVLQPDRSPSYLPLVQVAFVLQNASNQEVRLPGLSLSWIEATTETAKFDLTLSIDELESGLVASMEYSTDLFEGATITRLLAHYRNLLEAIAANPGLRLSELPLLSATEKRQLLTEWNNTTTPYPAEKCVHELFEEQVERTPEAIAVALGSEALTYRQLNTRANQLAHYLRGLGVGPEVCVGILLKRSCEMVMAWLAVIKAGGVYVPLDSTYPQDRLAYMLRDTQAPVLLTKRDLAPGWLEGPVKAVCLDDEALASSLREHAAENPVNRTQGSSSIYVIYTSGSTGAPKGVVVPHRAVNRLVKETNYVQFAASDVMGQISNSSFDAATFEVWGALLHGAKLVIVPREVLLSPEDFARAIKEQGITTFFITSSLFNQMSQAVPDIFATMRYVLVGGEAVVPRHAAAVLRNGAPEYLLNGYGPTETTTFAVTHRIAVVPEGAINVPIGRPIANTQAFVLDRDFNPVPVGVIGDLYLGGPGLARGYLNQPDLTAAKFVPHPFGTPTGARLYRTGDRARYRPDGIIEFLGRIDHQVKIRGFRIELGEIESILRTHAGVKECLVDVAQDDAGDKRVLAYVIPKPQVAPTVSDLRQFLQTKLPDYMIPSAVGFLDALPLSSNGKVNRRALPPLESTRADTEEKYAAPRDELERQLVKIWETALGVRPIGVTDKFFELGGHSLLAVRVISQIEQTFGRKLRLAAVFQCPTVELLANVLRDQSPMLPRTAMVEIQPKGSRPPLILVHGVGGGMFWGYTNLTRYLGLDQPVYGLKSRGLDGLEEFGRIEEMAAHYVSELRSFQPRGPYYLGGYCFGGDVAYEMACQLQNQGQPVALLVLMDCSAPNSSYDQVRWTPRYSLKFVKNLWSWVGNFNQLSRNRRREYVRWKARAMLKRFLSVLNFGSGPGSDDVAVDTLADLSGYDQEQRALWEAHIRALLAYHPKPYSGRVVLFRTRGHPLFCSFDPLNGWGNLVPRGLEVKIVPGVHESMLEEPQVRRLAAELKAYLE